MLFRSEALVKFPAEYNAASGVMIATKYGSGVLETTMFESSLLQAVMFGSCIVFNRKKRLSSKFIVGGGRIAHPHPVKLILVIEEGGVVLGYHDRSCVNRLWHGNDASSVIISDNRYWGVVEVIHQLSTQIGHQGSLLSD